MKSRFGLFVVTAALLASAGGASFAHKGATGVVKKRMEAMKGVAAAMKSIAPMMQGKTAYDVGRVRAAAGTVKGHAAQVPDLFPNGSNAHPSEASAKIWSDWDKFLADAKAFETRAAELEAVAATGPDAARPAFAALTETCKSCHQAYRVKKQ